jgi:positive regulator of sigma E activity
MHLIQEGIVIQNEEGFARVRIQQHSSCDSCGACESPETIVLVQNSLNAVPGQKVRFTTAQSNMIKISFILFFFPMLSIFAGAGAGYLLAKFLHFSPDLWMLLFGSLFFVLSIIGIIITDKKMKLKPNYFPQITDILS